MVKVRKSSKRVKTRRKQLSKSRRVKGVVNVDQ